MSSDIAYIHQIKHKKYPSIVDGKKRCTSCDQWLPLDQFYKRVSQHKGCKFLPTCRKCNRENQRIYVKNNPEIVKHTMRWSKIKRNYGLSKKDYITLWEKQNGKCAICGIKEEDINFGRPNYQLCVDHDHKTNIVRGLLCYHCNVAIGLLRHDLNTLKNAIIYLDRKEI